jgi:septal ring factor EnvC (AmiA/AmiB activator)
MPPEQAVRGVLVLGGLTRTLEHEAAALRAEQAQVASLQTEMDTALPGLTAAKAAQAQQAQALDAQLAEARRARRAAEDAATEAARRAAADASRADSIRAAIARLEADRRAAEEKAQTQPAAQTQTSPAPPPPSPAPVPQTASMAEAHGQLTAPVAGSVVRAYGSPTEAGPASGVMYQAPPNARVVSPCGGRVVFAGPFRSFGLLMIVDCGGGYHFVMSGLERLDGQVGQNVQPGEPVGVMPGWDPQNPGAGRPTLYLELRKDGAPVNPAPFLRARS